MVERISKTVLRDFVSHGDKYDRTVPEISLNSIDGVNGGTIKVKGVEVSTWFISKEYCWRILKSEFSRILAFSKLYCRWGEWYALQ